ncbi:ribosomal protein L4 domain-containing protein [Lentinula edodes]|uniref:Large ribosomal subunit protein uL4m n=1 Tax=Lentinula lateritia TaxID=40482 RepID=A0A9W9AMS9_9AGAR|nr:ribosomal protein L4 domain-containing protein [Lentinula edodes]KAH7880832.1 ribosomal protein L4 domain-containing protein [Lentinula edodes]KAJ3894770.1 ribosomal protein L4 domain-containing protein [Lentinula edodes]KAJ4484781.1 ribosomal protein L4 domain-containing protein [Lentinula edodes]
MLKSTIPNLQSLKRPATTGRVRRFGPSSISKAAPPERAALLPAAPTTNVAPPAESVYVGLTASLHRPHEPTRNRLVALNPTVFHHPIRRDILHLCVNHYRDSLRQGSANTKTRGEVRGSGRKIRPQKGSGRARLGDAQSPMLRGGGVAFGPKPRDFSTKLPRKVIQMGMRVALSSKMLEHNLGVMKTMDWPSGKTKHLSHKIDSLGLKNTLFITGEEEVPIMLQRAIRNIPLTGLTTSKDVNVYEMLKWSRVMLDAKAVEFFERTLGKTHSIVDVVSSGSL